MKRKLKSIVIGETFCKWKVINIDKNNSKDKYKVFCECSCGETKKYVGAKALIDGDSTKCRKCADRSHKLIGDRLMIAHNNYIKKKSLMKSPVKVKEGHFYTGASEKLTHICPFCGKDWETMPTSILSGVMMCEECSNSRIESLTANVLKQIFKHYYSNSKPECDLGFRSDNGKVCNYDLFVPELNIVFEFQSRYHDTKKQKDKDKKKKEYILNHQNNYEYISLDHRDYSLMEAIQIFFPEIKEIPDYVDVFRNSKITWDLKKAQELLNEFKTYQEIADCIGVSCDSISYAIRFRKLQKPKGYICLNERRWSVEKAQELLNQKKYNYQEIADLLGSGCTAVAIERAVGRGTLTKTKYSNKLAGKKIEKAVLKLSLDGSSVFEYPGKNYVEDYSSSAIGRACRGEYIKNGHEYKGYIWYYKSDYEEIIKDDIGQAV